MRHGEQMPKFPLSRVKDRLANLDESAHDDNGIHCLGKGEKARRQRQLERPRNFGLKNVRVGHVARLHETKNNARITSCIST